MKRFAIIMVLLSIYVIGYLVIFTVEDVVVVESGSNIELYGTVDYNGKKENAYIKSIDVVGSDFRNWFMLIGGNHFSSSSIRDSIFYPLRRIHFAAIYTPPVYIMINNKMVQIQK